MWVPASFGASRQVLNHCSQVDGVRGPRGVPSLGEVSVLGGVRQCAWGDGRQVCSYAGLKIAPICWDLTVCGALFEPPCVGLLILVTASEIDPTVRSALPRRQQLRESQPLAEISQPAGERTGSRAGRLWSLVLCRALDLGGRGQKGTRLSNFQTPCGSVVNSCTSVNYLKGILSVPCLYVQVGERDLPGPCKSKYTVRLVGTREGTWFISGHHCLFPIGPQECS